MPPREAVKLDVLELDIKKETVMLRGTTDSRPAVDDLEKSLKSIDCYSKVTRGKVVEDSQSEVSFTLTASSKCM
jgi:hypothetical protein